MDTASDSDPEYLGEQNPGAGSSVDEAAADAAAIPAPKQPPARAQPLTRQAPAVAMAFHLPPCPDVLAVGNHAVPARCGPEVSSCHPQARSCPVGMCGAPTAPRCCRKPSSTRTWTAASPAAKAAGEVFGAPAAAGGAPLRRLHSSMGCGRAAAAAVAATLTAPRTGRAAAHWLAGQQGADALESN